MPSSIYIRARKAKPQAATPAPEAIEPKEEEQAAPQEQPKPQASIPAKTPVDPNKAKQGKPQSKP